MSVSAAEHSEIWVTHREWNPVDGTEGALSFPAAVNSVISVVLSWRKESQMAHAQHCSLLVTQGIHLQFLFNATVPFQAQI